MPQLLLMKHERRALAGQYGTAQTIALPRLRAASLSVDTCSIAEVRWAALLIWLAFGQLYPTSYHGGQTQLARC